MMHDGPMEPDPPAEPADFDAGFWTDSVIDGDLGGSNIFTAEIENVISSDWEMDPDVIWGDEPGVTTDVDGGSPGADFAV
ncbi:hypothetical protein [Microbacterium sp. NPDC089696]|uniref:hypothetical protein n=1 Tax=Microbacterium sp. NPDC089696 TaxID=3364199 RepID=UPI003800A882